MLDKKCLYKKRIEVADSIARMESTSKNSVSMVGAEKVLK